jgi:N-glycosylase/DNA lyase
MGRVNLSREKTGLGRLEAKGFSLARTLQSGQVFHWTELEDGWWEGAIGEVGVRLRQHGDVLEFSGAAEQMVHSYLALDHPMKHILQSFPPDDFLREARQACAGLRILRQPLWECLGTFLISPLKQVGQIREISLRLRERWGGSLDGVRGKSFPSAQVVARLREADLRAVGLGFRAAKLLGSARALVDGVVDLEALRNCPTEEAGRALRSLPGVGPKVADCVLLFAFERLEVAPVDVWIERVLRRLPAFARGRTKAGRMTLPSLREAARQFLGPYGGYAQQFLFHHARVHGALPQEA